MNTVLTCDLVERSLPLDHFKCQPGLELGSVAAKVRELLGIGQTQVCKIAREGRINYIVRNGRRCYLLEDVET